MGHEITHALLRHGAQRMTEQKLAQLGKMAGAMSGMNQQQMQMAMSIYGYGRSLPYARKQESQADEMGLMLAAAACSKRSEGHTSELQSLMRISYAVFSLNKKK